MAGCSAGPRLWRRRHRRLRAPASGTNRSVEHDPAPTAGDERRRIELTWPLDHDSIELGGAAEARLGTGHRCIYHWMDIQYRAWLATSARPSMCSGWHSAPGVSESVGHTRTFPRWKRRQSNYGKTRSSGECRRLMRPKAGSVEGFRTGASPWRDPGQKTCLTLRSGPPSCQLGTETDGR